MLTLAAVVFGWVSFGKLPIELLPDISYPSLTIQTELPDAAPEEVEQLVTDRIEERVAVVGGMKRYHSVSRAGSSEITLEFGWNVDMTAAALDVREKLDLVELPDQARLPIVFRFDPSLDPILRLALTGDLPVADLRRLAEDVVKQRLEVLDGVAAAKVVGGAEEEVRVLLNEARITQLGLTISEVARRLSEENVNTSGGELRDAETAYLLRTVKEFGSLQDIEETILVRQAGREVRVKDVGRVVLGFRDEEIRVRVDGVPAIELHIYKEGDANAVEVARGVRAALAKFQLDRRLSGVTPVVLFDQARYIEESVDNVQSTALLGGILAALILFFFLRDLLSTLVIAISIPISVAVTFFLMQLSGVTLNVMSLGGLALGIGMLVDNSVVVLESIRRRREQMAGSTAQSSTKGSTPSSKEDSVESEGASAEARAETVDCVVEGSREVIGGVIASTLTTVSVFLPLVFVEGVAGQLFGDQALVVTFSLLASLVVSITVIPSLLGNRWGEPDHIFSRASRALQVPLTPLLALFERGVKGATALYSRLLKASLRAVWAAPAIALVLFVTITPQVRNLGTELVPDLFQGQFYFDVELAEGTPIDVTDDRVQLLESALREEVRARGLPVDRIFVSVGGTPVLGDVQAGDQQEHVARVNVSLEPGTSSETEAEVVVALEDAMRSVPNVHPHLGRPSLFTFRDPIEVEVYADELPVLRESALAFAERMRGIPGIWDVDSGVSERSPEFHVSLDPIRLADRKLSQGEVAAELASKALGSVSTQYAAGPKPIDIRVLADGIRRGKREDFSRLSVRPGMDPDNADAPPLLLAALGNLVEGLGPVEVRHLNGERAAQITARVQGRDLGSVSADVEELLTSRLLPPNASAKLSGQNEEMAESLGSLLFALALAIFLVYLVLASSFESLRLPFVIILTVPLGLIGAVVALWIAGSAVGVLAMIGLIMLSGIVVNNGIIFIARIQQHAEAGLSGREAAARAGVERLRPILITTSTTVLGLLPLAVGWGAGAELRQPLAITVIGGLVGATILALFVVPSGYLLLSSRSRGSEDSA